MKKTIIALSALLCVLTLQAQRPQVTAVQIGKRIDVTIGKKFFTSYHFADNEKYPFFFPLNAPQSGSSVSSMRNGEYPHHSSLWFACDKVNGGNYWQEGLDRGRIVSIGARITEATGEKVVIEDECVWKRPNADAPIMDKRKITIGTTAEGDYQIDFDIALTMLIDVTIEKTNHSLFSARIDADLSVRQGGVMVNNNGDETEKGTFGVASPWIDCYGSRKSGVEGIALMQHPSNRWYPAPWFTRDYGFISPTPMYWPEDDKSTKLKQGQSFSLRYRVIVHKGDTKAANIAQQFEQYKQQ